MAVGLGVPCDLGITLLSLAKRLPSLVSPPSQPHTLWGHLGTEEELSKRARLQRLSEKDKNALIGL